MPLPLSGTNFTAYSGLAELLDRNYVHSKVAGAVIEAYDALSKSHKELVFVYGETGHQKGGSFPPHRTHQNGLSVDFMVPVRNTNGKPASLPTNPFNRYGYGLEFDRQGRMRGYQIDFEAIALHLEALHRSAKRSGLGMQRVILDPAYHPALFATSQGPSLRSQLTFRPHQAWVRHDEHYHVDFSLPCKPLR
ncbi:penicillin-insensitive murein endopeptidase [Microvirga sp. M2]|uniref:penicillin-insensitive murein endopeptidase n=1 Tax=Microvirga sp. M2 TaxID=3073270 RepID=UPI0039C33FBA